ncbi:GumC family protein [Hoeflea sp. WL0058]|uniref:GumC family protein n=1 Tax=Flavimaribacter sediminis TaxID=2865987 RepID=A0AAE2ZMN9_9HYPH|nr:GumC family protein [Flavimaribacter sediminis]MBW8637485.1 GumC family protein [Flavimaribacter sediminis]
MTDPQEGKRKHYARSLLNASDDDVRPASPARSRLPDADPGARSPGEPTENVVSQSAAPVENAPRVDRSETILQRMRRGLSRLSEPEKQDAPLREDEDARTVAAHRPPIESERPAAARTVFAERRPVTETIPEQADMAASQKPLVDPVVLFRTVWRWRLLVVLTTIIGGVLGAMIALSTPHQYLAISQFVYDPRELRLTETDFLPPSYSSESTLALVDSQVRIVSSVPVLETVVADLDLTSDPEFNGKGAPGFGSVLGTLSQLLSGSEAEDSESMVIAVQNLASAVNVYRVPNTFIIHIAVTTEDPVISANIANAILDVYIEKRQSAQSALFERTAEAMTKQLADLRRDVEIAEQKVEQYKAEHDIVGAGGSLINDEQLVKLNEQLADIRAQKVEIQAKAETARNLNVDEILSGTSSEILESSTIGELRAAYAASKRSFDALTTSLGPRHPRRVAAAQTLETARSEVSNELRRIVSSTQTELRRIVQSEQQLAADLAVLKSRQMDTSEDLVRLRELEREANATSAIYESSLKRTRETREQQNLNTSNIRIVAEATTPIDPVGPSRKLIAIGGAMAGLIFGLGVAVLIGLYRGLVANNAGLFSKQQPRPQENQPVPVSPPVRRSEREEIIEAYRRPAAASEPDPEPQSVATPTYPEQRYDDEPVQDRQVSQPIGQEDYGTDDPDKIREDIRDLKETVERFRKAREEARRNRRVALF